jgi:hypothetical protein
MQELIYDAQELIYDAQELIYDTIVSLIKVKTMAQWKGKRILKPQLPNFYNFF